MFQSALTYLLALTSQHVPPPPHSTPSFFMHTGFILLFEATKPSCRMFGSTSIDAASSAPYYYWKFRIYFVLSGFSYRGQVL